MYQNSTQIPKNHKERDYIISKLNLYTDNIIYKTDSKNRTLLMTDMNKHFSEKYVELGYEKPIGMIKTLMKMIHEEIPLFPNDFHFLNETWTKYANSVK